MSDAAYGVDLVKGEEYTVLRFELASADKATELVQSKDEPILLSVQGAIYVGKLVEVWYDWKPQRFIFTYHARLLCY